MSETFPGSIIGYRKNGTPIRLIAGGSTPAEPQPGDPTPPTPIPTPATAGIPQHRPPAPQSPAPGQNFDFGQFQAQLEQERAERERIAAQFSEAQQTLAQLQAEREEREAQARAEAERLAEEQRKAREEEMSVRQLLEQERAERERSAQQFQQELEKRDTLLRLEREQAELNAYKAQKLAELQEPNPQTGHPGIHPALRDLVTGSTREAIDASVNSMVQRTGVMLEEMKQDQLSAARSIPGVSPTAGNIGIMEQQDQTRTFSPEDLQGIAPGSPEHLALRQQYNIAGRGNGQGMFG